MTSYTLSTKIDECMTGFFKLCPFGAEPITSLQQNAYELEMCLYTTESFNCHNLRAFYQCLTDQALEFGADVTGQFWRDIRTMFNGAIQMLDSKGMATVYTSYHESTYSILVHRHGGKQRTQTMKIGRFLSKYFNIPEIIISKAIEAYVAAQNPIEYIKTLKLTHKSGQERADFKFAYAFNWQGTERQKAVARGKSIADSCMQGPTSSARWASRSAARWAVAHPAEAYASGDFTIHYLTDADNKPVARCVVVNDHKAAAPVYALDSRYAAALRAAIEACIGVPLASLKSSFSGKRLLRIEAHGQCALPYLDCGNDADDCGSYLRICSGGAMSSSTAGYADTEEEEEEEYYGECYQCGDALEVGDYTYLQCVEADVCDYCRDRHFFESDYSHETFSDSESCRVIALNRRGEYVNQDWSDDEASNYAFYCDHMSDYYAEGATVTLFDGTVIGGNCSDLIQCEVTGDWYLDDSEDWIAHQADIDEQARIAALPFAEQPVIRCPWTPDFLVAHDLTLETLDNAWTPCPDTL